MFRKHLGLLATVLALATAMPGTVNAQQGYQQSYGDYSGGWDGRDSNRGDWRGDGDRGDGRHDGSWGERYRSGSVSIRNSRSSRVHVQLRDSRGVVRSSFYLGSGERRYVRTEARSSWSVSYRSYKTYRRNNLSDIGYFDDGRWYVRIR